MADAGAAVVPPPMAAGASPHDRSRVRYAAILVVQGATASAGDRADSSAWAPPDPTRRPASRCNTFARMARSWAPSRAESAGSPEGQGSHCQLGNPTDRGL